MTITIKYTPDNDTSTSYHVSHEFQVVRDGDYFAFCRGLCRWNDVPIISTYLYQDISHDLSGFTTLTVEVVNQTTTVGINEIVGFDYKLFCYNTSPPTTPAHVLSGSTPTTNPTLMPTIVPTVVSLNPMATPTNNPTTFPTPTPTDDPTPLPTDPHIENTNNPRSNPTQIPTLAK